MKINHNHYAASLVSTIAVFLIWLPTVNPEVSYIALSGVLAESLHRLMLYTAWTFGLLVFLGGIRVDVVEETRTHPLALALLAGALILGASIAVSH